MRKLLGFIVRNRCKQFNGVDRYILCSSIPTLYVKYHNHIFKKWNNVFDDLLKTIKAKLYESNKKFRLEPFILDLFVRLKKVKFIYRGISLKWT